MTTFLEILLVEDNEGDVEMTQLAFRNSKPACNLSITHDGVEALEFLHKQGNFASAPTLQLIFLDLNMPRMDGKRFLEEIKMDANLKVIPVIMFTSSKSPKDIRECYERYASAYVVKPFEGSKFGDALRQIVIFWNELGRLPGEIVMV